MAFQIIRDDITKVSADAIVNTANPKPACACDTDGAIFPAAGAEALLTERQQIGNIAVGQAAVTSAFALDAKYMIHTMEPVWQDGFHGEREALRSCYENSLRLAKELGCESIAFPLFAAGVYGFQKAEALQIAVSVFRAFLDESEMKILLVVSDTKSFTLPGKIFEGIDTYIDEKYVTAQPEEEYAQRAAENPEKTRGFGLSGFLRGVRDFTHAGSVQKDGRRKENRKSALASESVCAKDAYGENPEDVCMEDAPCLNKVSSNPAPFATVEASLAGAAMSAEMSMKPQTLDDRMSHVADSWQESLFHLIDEKGFTDTEVYKRANVDRKLFSKIRSNSAYQPKKITAMAFVLALRLNLDEARDLLARAGYAFSPSSRFDLIVEYFIENEVYDIYTINLALFEHEQPLLGE